MITNIFRVNCLRSSSFRPLHTRAQVDIHTRRDRESKAFGNLLQVELVDVKYRAQRMRGVGLQVGAVAIFRGLVGSQYLPPNGDSVLKATLTLFK